MRFNHEYRVLLRNGKKEVILHDPFNTNLETHLESPTLNQTLNAVHTFSFNIYSIHPYFNDLHAFHSDIIVRDMYTQKDIFRGKIIQATPRVLSEGAYIKEILCEDALGLLNNSRQKFQKFDNVPISKYLEEMLEYHSSRLGQKKIKLGKCEYSYTVRTVNNWENTLELIVKHTVEHHGGYLYITYDDFTDERILNYTKTYGRVNNQPVIVGTNLLELTMQTDYSHVMNKFIPLGAEIMPKKEKPPRPKKGEKVEKPKKEEHDPLKDTYPRVEIHYLNPGFTEYKNYIYDQESVSEIGEIEGTKIYDDIDNKEDLLKQALKDSKDMNKPRRSLELRALDLRKLGYTDLDTFQLGDKVRIICYDLGLDESFQINEVSFPIDSPEETVFKFGTHEHGMVGGITSITSNLSGLGSKISRVHADSIIDMNDIVDKQIDLANDLVDNVDKLTDDIDKVTGDLGVFKIETENSLATKVGDGEFKSYKIQTANQLASKVEGSEFRSYQIQTDNAIVNRVTNDQFDSFRTQTAEALVDKVSNTEFNSYTAQTADKLQLVVQDNNRVNSASIALAISEDHSALQLLADRIEIKPHSGIIEFPNGTDIDTRDSSGQQREHHIRLRADPWNYILVDQQGAHVYKHDESTHGTTSFCDITPNGFYWFGRKVAFSYA